MKIAIGADHRGFTLKKSIIKYLIRRGHAVKDYGTDSSDPVDYPDIAFQVGEAVASPRFRFGILICFTGQGMIMSANRVAGIRAALCTDAKAARMTRAHNNANILVIPGYISYGTQVRSIITAFFTTPFDGGRHARRVHKITQYEKKSAHKKV